MLRIAAFRARRRAAAVSCRGHRSRIEPMERRLLMDALPAWDYSNTNVYLCGPMAFMQIQWQNLLKAGVPVSHLHREVFGPELLDNLL